MRSVALCLFFLALSQAATRNVTVLLSFEKPHSNVSIVAFRQELRQLLEPAGITVDVMLKSEVPAAPQFGELVVFEMKGLCSMHLAPVSSEPGTLALAHSSDGQILHFGEVECDHVRQCLQRITGGGRPDDHEEAEFGAALGIVVAHEIYHMIAGEREHTKQGLTKESLSARELLDGELSLPAVVREELRRDSLDNAH